jgi:hypothetical protein
MKDVGFTKDGNHLVEMNRTEYANLTRLCIAVENRSLSFPIEPREYFFEANYDFSNTFEVIRAFYDARFRITDLQRQLDGMRESLNK